MSNPKNELSKYRSYSYYHVLAICNSSAAAADLADSHELDAWNHAVSNNKLGKYGPKSVGEGGGYCVLINGSTDSEFTITKASWTSITAASAVEGDRFTSNANEGIIAVSEPRGIIFLDQIVKCCMALGIDSSSAFWVLKTFFVGYTHNTESGEDGIDFINTIPPLIFIAYDVIGSFSLAGGEYEISVVGAANGVTRLPQYSQIPYAMHIAKSSSFSGMLENLQTSINENYKRYFECAQKVLNDFVDVDNLRPVKYFVTCDDIYKDSRYIVLDKPAQYKDDGKPCAPVTVSIESNTSIESAIWNIINHTPAFAEDTQKGSKEKNGNRIQPKIHTWLSTTPKKDEKTGKIYFEVGYNVYPFTIPQSVSFDDAQGIKDNIITFDYIYTGKNIDILEMDIKMNMGMAYLQAMTLTSNFKQPRYEIPVGTIAFDSNNSRILNSGNIPVYFGGQIKNVPMKDAKNPLAASQFVYSMTKHASLEVLESSIKITGNSQLLGSTNITTDVEKMKKGETNIKSDDNFARFANWSLAPAFLKINIKMPRNGDDQSLFTGLQTSMDAIESNDYAVDWWFKGYYYVISVQHVFDNGEFYQILDTIGIPEHNLFAPSDTTSEFKGDLTKAIDDCYSPKPVCTPVSSSDGGGGSNNGGPGGPAIPVALKGSAHGRAMQVMRDFTSLGYSTSDAAGLVACFASESGVRPFVWGDSGKAYGLGQWHPDRRAEYYKLFGHAMTSVTDQDQAMHEQTVFAAYELKHKESYAWSQINQEPNTPYARGHAFRWHWERPREKVNNSHTTGRMAEGFYNDYVKIGGNGITDPKNLPETPPKDPTSEQDKTTPITKPPVTPPPEAKPTTNIQAIGGTAGCPDGTTQEKYIQPGDCEPVTPNPADPINKPNWKTKTKDRPIKNVTGEYISVDKAAELPDIKAIENKEGFNNYLNTLPHS